MSYKQLYKSIGRTIAAAAVALMIQLPVASAQAPTIVRLADQVSSEVDYAAVWVADHEGYYRDEGIKIERHTYSNGPTGLLHYANGEVDMEVGGLTPFMQAAARGTKFIMLMSVTKNNAPLVGNKKYKSWKDLDGKTIGSPGLGTVHDAILSYVESTMHLHFKRRFASVTSFATMAKNNEIAAFITWEPAAATAVSQNPELHYIEQFPPIPHAESLELIVSPEFAKKHPKVVTGFVRATLRGIQYIKTHSVDDVAKIVAKKMNNPGAVGIAKLALGSVILTDPRVDMPSTTLIVKAAINSGKIPKKYAKDVKGWMHQYIDYSYLERAEKSLK